MYRATTPKHVFTFDVNPDEMFSQILITYVQNGKIILEKHKEDLTFGTGTGCDGKSVFTATATLTQEETKFFKENGIVSIQIRALTYDGEAVASDKMSISVQNVLNDEVLQ